MAFLGETIKVDDPLKKQTNEKEKVTPESCFMWTMDSPFFGY